MSDHSFVNPSFPVRVTDDLPAQNEQKHDSNFYQILQKQISALRRERHDSLQINFLKQPFSNSPSLRGYDGVNQSSCSIWCHHDGIEHKPISQKNICWGATHTIAAFPVSGKVIGVRLTWQARTGATETTIAFEITPLNRYKISLQ